MSKEFPAIPVIEWSPSSVRVLKPGSDRIVVGTSIASIKSALDDAKEVVVAISRRSAFLRTVRLPDAPKKEVAKILALQVGQLFPLSPSDAAVDFYLTSDKNAEGRLAVVAAVKGDTIQLLTDELEAEGLTARAVVPASLGSALLARTLGKRECAIVEKVPEGLAIDVIAEGELRTSRVSPDVDVASVTTEVDRTFAVAKVPKSEIVAAGGFAFPEADHHVSASTLGALQTGNLPLTLERPDAVAKREKARQARVRRVALILWVAAIMLVAVIWDLRSREMEVLAKGQEKWRKSVNTHRKTKDQNAAKLASLQKIDTALDAAFESKQKLSDVVVLLNNLAPEGVWLTGITLERGKLAQFRGTATTGEAVNRFHEILATQPRFRDVRLIFANSGQIEKVNVVQFSISAHIVGNFPLEQETKR